MLIIALKVLNKWIEKRAENFVFDREVNVPFQHMICMLQFSRYDYELLSVLKL